MRRGAEKPGGRSLAWVQDARNKQSITLNLRQEAGRAIVHRLLPHFDAMVTNFRPPTLQRWGFDPATIQARHPRLIALYVTGYGLTGPYASRGAFDRVASAFSGVTYTSGERGGPSMRAGYALVDYMTAYMGAFSVASALYHRDCHGGSGQVIDLALFEPAFRASEDALIRYAKTGKVRERTGNINPNVVPAANFLTADGREIAIHAGTDSLLRRLAGLIGEPDLATDARFSTHAARVRNQEALYARIATWTARQTLAEAMERLVAADIPASPVMNIADIAADPHYRARGTVREVEDAEHGRLMMTAPLPHMSATPGTIRSLGPELGSANQAILGGLLGMSAAELERLRGDGVI